MCQLIRIGIIAEKETAIFLLDIISSVVSYGGLGISLGGIMLELAGIDKMKKAVDLYNDGKNNISVSFANTGIGFAINF